MRILSQLIGLIAHPLLIPAFGAFFYFQVTPKYSPPDLQRANILPIFILTAIIPLISMIILQNLGLIRSARMKDPDERVYPLLVGLVLLLMVLLQVIPNNYTPELYFYILGLTIAAAACLLLALTRKIVSLHMVGMGSLLAFMIALSIHFEKNIIVAISLCTMACGLVAMARLYLKIHGRAGVFTGLLIGLVSQLLLIRFWV